MEVAVLGYYGHTVTNLAKLATSVTEFALAHAITLIPVVPERDFGPEVRITADTMDLPAFLALAAKLGGGVLYLKPTVFNPDDDADEVEDPPAHLVAHKGEICQVSVAFALNGLVHFWEQSAAWHVEWSKLANVSTGRRWLPAQRDAEDTERPSEEEQTRLTAELVTRLLADPAFRAAKPGGGRHRYARIVAQDRAYQWVRWDAIRQAQVQADELAREQYDQIMPRLDDLAAELLATNEYQQASSPAARKLAVQEFLIPRADGFAPTTLVRDELYARAQRLAKAAKNSATLL